MSDRPATIVLVHGAWHGSWCWEKVVALLETRGLRARAVDLPSIGAPPGSGAGPARDAAAVDAVLDAVDGPVVLCGHSYGGMVISSVTSPNVVHLVYVCAFMPEAGESLAALTGGQLAPWIQLGDDGMTLPDPAQSTRIFYGDCDAATADRSTRLLKRMPAEGFTEPLLNPTWRNVPSTYVVCAQDQAMPAEVQRGVFAPRATQMLELDASHSPFLSQPDAVAQVLARLATTV